ncbi:MAG: thiamine diphosphokinase [Ilumatobacteraceae bacterium]
MSDLLEGTAFPAVDPVGGPTVVLVIGGDALHPDAVAAVPDDAVIMAADSGLDHARSAGLTPTVLIGDLDSVSAEGLAWAEGNSAIERHPVDKDATDTELALRHAVGLNPSRIVLMSGGGDRIDHTLAAIGALGEVALTSVPVLEAWWGRQRVRVVQGPGRARVAVTPGSTVSLLALHGPCAGVSLTGTRWPLERADLEAMSGLGVSNVALDETVEVSVSTGVVSLFWQVGS